MKKICFITTKPSTINAFIIEIAMYLHESGNFEITFISDYDEKFAKSLSPNFNYVPVSMERGINFKGVKAILQMIKVFKREKFDLVQYSTPNASLYASIAAKIAGIPVRLYCQWGIIYVGFSGIKRKVFKSIEKLVCSFSSWIEPDSYGNLEFSYQEGLYTAKKSSVVWNGSAIGVNLRKFDFNKRDEWNIEIRKKYNISNETFVMGFVGRITGDKGFNELLTATKNFFYDYPNSRLLVIGDKEKENSLNKMLIKWSEHEERIIYCGSTNEVEKYFATMDVFILPSYREGFGSVVIESEAMGTPVIVSDIPGPTDAMISEVTGLLSKKADSASLEKCMRELYNDRDKLEEMSIKATKYASENFDSELLKKFILLDRDKLLKGMSNK